MNDIPRDTADTKRGWGPWGRTWYSICSQHQRFNKTCSRCAKGMWVNDWSRAVGHVFYTITPGLWRVWANRDKGWVRAWKSRTI